MTLEHIGIASAIAYGLVLGYWFYPVDHRPSRLPNQLVNDSGPL
jgi:hypothetical protein